MAEEQVILDCFTDGVIDIRQFVADTLRLPRSHMGDAVPLAYRSGDCLVDHAAARHVGARAALSLLHEQLA